MKTLGVIVDPLERIHPEKDTTLAFLLEAQARGWALEYIQPAHLFARMEKPCALASQLKVFDDKKHWFEAAPQREIALTDCDIILMRQDPPFNMQYIYATYLLELAEQQGVLVVNKPQSLRDANEKLFIAQFPQCCPPFIVSQHLGVLEDFIHQEKDVILKPLDGMGGAGIFRLKASDKDFVNRLEASTQHATKTVMLQRYLPEISQGDKRIILINGDPIPYALARMPAEGEVRANLAQGGRGEVRELTARDQWICEQVKPVLQLKGLRFVGIDVIGDHLTEINVTSPTGVRELDKHCNINVAKIFFDGLL